MTRFAVLPLLLAIAVPLGLAGCEEYGVPAGSEPHRELNFLDMGDQPKGKAQRGDLLGSADFMPPEGAIPRGFVPYPYPEEAEVAGAKLQNPLPERDGRIVARGKLMFARYCVPCHDQKGSGKGKVIEKGFPAPPSLMTKKVRDWTDGRIYHVISQGQNIMPSYAAQVRPGDRWALIRYLRQLQSTQPVAPAPKGQAPAPSEAAPAAPPASASGSAAAVVPGPSASSQEVMP